MKSRPPLGPRALASYRRLRLETDALISAVEHRKPTGPVGQPTLETFETIRYRANKLFCRYADLPWFPWVSGDTPITQADFVILATRLAAALKRLETIHADQLGFEDWDGDHVDDADEDAPL